MPPHGAQHQFITNPYEEESKPRISEYTADQIHMLQHNLEKRLGPEYVSYRSGPGGQKVPYLAAEKSISLANEIFGFNGWSSSIQNIQVDYVEENPNTLRVSLGLSVVMRVTLRDGTFHEDIGYGHMENSKGKAAAFEKAKKEATTDGLKRALRTFGNVLGNCIYDKDYLAKVTKFKVAPARKFELENLHRHRDYVIEQQPMPAPRPVPPVGPVLAAPIPAAAAAAATTTSAAVSAPPDVGQKPPAGIERAESVDSYDEFLGDFDESDFCVGEDNLLNELLNGGGSSSSSDKAAPTKPSTAQRPAQMNAGPVGKATDGVFSSNGAPQTPGATATYNRPPAEAPRNLNQNLARAPNAANRSVSNPIPHNASLNNNLNMQTPPPQAQKTAIKMDEPIAFFSARAVPQVPDSGNEDLANAPLPVPAGQQAFNLHAQSPSIRKTPGIDHSSSKPLGRNGQHVAAPTAEESSTASAAAKPSNGTSFNASSRTSIANSNFRSPVTTTANPQINQTRRIGVPGAAGSPLSNRASYKPPTMKRPLPGDGRGMSADASNNGPGGGEGNGSRATTPVANAGLGDASKRQRMT